MRLCNNKLALWPWTHAWTLYLFTDHFSDARISRMSLSTLMEAISRSSQSISSQPVCVCLRVQKFQGGAQRGIENPQGILPWSAEYTRVYCTGVPQIKVGSPNSL